MLTDINVALLRHLCRCGYQLCSCDVCLLIEIHPCLMFECWCGDQEIGCVFGEHGCDVGDLQLM